MKKVLSNFLYRCWQIFAGLIILLAVLISIARVLTPYINDYRPQIEDWLSIQIGQNVSIGQIKSEWKMLGPSLTLYDINVENVIDIGALNADIKTIPSLFYGSLITDNLAISGINLLLQQNAAGGFSLSTTTDSSAESTALSVAAVQDWFQSQTTVNLLGANIEIILRNGESYPIEIAQMQYASGRNLSQLSGYSQLPGDNRIDFTLEMDGYLSNPETKGQLYIDTHVLDLTKIPLSAFWQEAKIQDGTVAIELWLDWQNSAFKSGLATIDVNEFQINLQDIPQGRVNRLSTQIMWQAQTDGWQLQTYDAAVTSHGREWPEPFVQLRQIRHAQSTNLGYYLRSSLVDIGIIADLILAKQDLDEQLRSRLLTMDTHGFLDALQIDAVTDSGELTDINLSARFSELRFKPYETSPGINNLSGQIQFNENKGNLYLDSRYTKLDYPEMFRWPLDFQYINADLDWQIEEDGFGIILQHLDMNIMGTELKADGIFNVANESDVIDMNLYAELDKGDMSKTRYLLPSGIMSPGLVKYLDESIVSGELNNVRVLLSGEAKDFPFTVGNGVFAIHGEVSNSEYVFQPDWPSLNDMNADLWFIGNGMDIKLTSANSYAQQIKSASASIKDFSAKPSILEVKATSQGQLEQAPEYLENSPLRDSFTE
ncbi:MAG: hypothetical protein HKP09_05565, partial [Enterobacterales bacterium]|nr:hypothetical protein [Enterobacterales bacterium]